MSFWIRGRARITTAVPHSAAAAGRPLSRLLAWGVIAGLVSIPCGTANAQCASMLDDGGFEEYRGRGGRWFAEGKAGIERQKGRSHQGDNNAWAGDSTGWNAIRQRVSLTKGHLYTLTVFVKTSGNVADGYFGFRDAGQRPVSEIKFASRPAYKEMRVRFRPARTGTYYVFAGFWAAAPGTWILVDDMRLDGPCGDTNLVPVDP